MFKKLVLSACLTASFLYTESVDASDLKQAQEEKKTPKVVLIVDDNSMNRCILSRLLTNAGYKAEVAENAVSGIKKAKKIKPSLIIMDFHMPEKGGKGKRNGNEAVKAIKENKATKHIPILPFTSDPEGEKALIAAGAEKRALKKPAVANEFLETLRIYLTSPREEYSSQEQAGGTIIASPRKREDSADDYQIELTSKGLILSPRGEVTSALIKKRKVK